MFQIRRSNGLTLDMNEEEIYTVLDEKVVELDELEDVLLSCNENAEIFTRSKIRNLYTQHSFDEDDNREKNLVLEWQILNTQKQFETNLSYLLIKQVTIKDAGIYYCVFRVSYLSFFSTIIPTNLINNLSKLWSGCQAVSHFECLASFKFKLIVRKSKKRILNPIRLSEEFNDKCLIIKNGKQFSQNRTLSIIAMFLSSLVFFFLLIYFIWMYRDHNSTSSISKKSYKKLLKKQRTEQINENLEFVKSLEHIKQDEQELLKKLRIEQERLSTKRREDEEFFNKIKNQELDLVKRKEKVLEEETELIKRKIEFENERKMSKKSNEDFEMKIHEAKESKLAKHLDDHFEVHANMNNKNLDEKKLVGFKLENPINLNLKGEIRLKSDQLNCNKNCHQINNDLIDVDGLSKRMKLNRQNIFKDSPKLDQPRSPLNLNKLDNLENSKTPKAAYKNNDNAFKFGEYSNLRLFNNRNQFNIANPTKRFSFDNRSPDKQRFKVNVNEDRKAHLKRKISRAINKREKVQSSAPVKNKTNSVNVESTISVLNRNDARKEPLFSTVGNFKIDSCHFDKPIKIIVESPFIIKKDTDNKLNLSK